MGPLSLAEFEGIQISKLDSSNDFRGTFFKFEPKKLLNHDIGTVAFSINPLIGTIRGLHFQIEPFAEEKIVTCLQGSVFDVIVDIRQNSKTFGRWSSFELNSKNRLQVFLPKGIAHGFQVLQSNSIIHYCLTSTYSKEDAFSINPFGNLEINWPLKSSAISDKDANGMELSEASLKYSASLENLQ
jgi:dTDP-4-dehydrorhamnose 3,5-epimerase